jgi:hypothetical protein
VIVVIAAVFMWSGWSSSSRRPNHASALGRSAPSRIPEQGCSITGRDQQTLVARMIQGFRLPWRNQNVHLICTSACRDQKRDQRAN